MKTISNGSITLTVTSGAYESYYKSHGWTETNSHEISTKNTEIPCEENLKDIYHVNGENAPASISVQETDEDLDEEELAEETETEDNENLDEDLSEKPLGQMSFEDLQTYAKSLKLDYKGLRSKKELRQLIRQNI